MGVSYTDGLRLVIAADWSGVGLRGITGNIHSGEGARRLRGSKRERQRERQRERKFGESVTTREIKKLIHELG